MNKCIILVPSMTPMGPIKGAVALANGLNDLNVDVTLVALKKGPGANTLLSPGVNLVELGHGSNFSFFQMVQAVREIVSDCGFGGSCSIPVISMCFSADAVNLFVRGNVKRVSSVRGDLKMNYSLDYKFFGDFFAFLHYSLLRFFDLTFALNVEMKEILKSFGCHRVVVVPNFLNERDFKGVYKNKSIEGSKRIIFVGSLTKRKMPMLLVDAITKLNEKGCDLDLVILGDGPLRGALENAASVKGNDRIEFIGFQNNPLAYVSNAHVMVLPSVSEGTPRAVMEALFIGIPCVMRNLTTNDSLVVDGVNGVLFDHDEELESAIVKSLEMTRMLVSEANILDDTFSQARCCESYWAEVQKL